MHQVQSTAVAETIKMFFIKKCAYRGVLLLAIDAVVRFLRNRCFKPTKPQRLKVIYAA